MTPYGIIDLGQHWGQELDSCDNTCQMNEDSNT